MINKSLPSIVGQYYSNILLTDPSGNPLTTISSRRAKWYLDRGLAVSLGEGEGYTNRVKLSFEPRCRNSNFFLKAILPTQCVVCGSKENLTLHHVIPMAVKRFFPQEDKDHTRQWCVLVCEEHHLEAEKKSRPYYERSLQSAVKSAQQEESDLHKSHYKLINMLTAQNIYLDKAIELLSPEERQEVGSLFESLKTTSNEFEQVRKFLNSLKERQKQVVKNAKQQWGKTLISEMGGVEKIKQIFRDAFLELQPQHLPEGFLVDIELLDAEEK